MRRVVGILVFMLLASYFMLPARAATVFSDDFNRSDEPLNANPNWEIVRGTWAVESGECSQSDSSLIRAHSVAGDSSWINSAIKVKAKIVDGLGVIVLFRYVDAKNWYEAFIRQDVDLAVISRYEEGKINWIARVPFACEPGVWYELRVEVFGSLIRFYVNNVLVSEATDSTFASGRIGIGALDAHVHFDDLEVANPSFNVVPEPAPFVISLMLIAGLARYGIIRRRSINGKISTS